MANEVQLSKRLSWLLRHGAVQEGIPICSDGFVPVNSIIENPKYACDYDLRTLQEIVRKDKKQRYTLRQNMHGLWEIRANQGHSMVNVLASHCLQRIYSSEEVNIAVHGTYYRHWERILLEGLRTMGRTHVHFAMYDDNRIFNQKNNAISGFRSDCELLIYLDVRKAMELGEMEIYRSTNNVILCAGINGCISKDYFKLVVDRRTMKALSF
ncbi:tRNA 2'-phosphotransferase 1 [Zeugodacus cucurbitae]|uniref:tRNA 2'-phosphotransferase 1 n=1 Tax=Zeugodacus cucurbitae TaxID=28588 RepID=UPI0005967F95|nr:tRNA 2'-phosphotransferase 1 [Zeugodacus cucurbitae]